jgi:hypothetical protein
MKTEWMKPHINGPDFPTRHPDETMLMMYKKGSMSENNAMWYIKRRFDHEPTWDEAYEILKAWCDEVA